MLENTAESYGLISDNLSFIEPEGCQHVVISRITAIPFRQAALYKEQSQKHNKDVIALFHDPSIVALQVFRSNILTDIYSRTVNGCWRITTFDKHGPRSHTEFDPDHDTFGIVYSLSGSITVMRI